MPKKKENYAITHLGSDAESLKKAILHHLHYTLAKDRYTATTRDHFNALAYTARDFMVKRWIESQRTYYDQDSKRVYYLSLEFLMGQSLKNSLINLGIFDECQKALKELDLELDDLSQIEWDAGLGNGGLGRLAACYLDSMATLSLPAYGYGIRYEYGIFYQKIEHGYQVETPDNWLRYGNPWEIGRAEYLYPVNYGGRVQVAADSNGKYKVEWTDTEEVIAMAYDTPVPGYGNKATNTLRLWSAKSSRGFDLNYFNHGDYIRAVEDSNKTENISRVLYPNDNVCVGRELRLKQEYFLVSATLQDIVRRYKKHHKSMDQFADKVAIQLNDTHPALAIPELMRIFIDKEGLDWDKAWDLTTKTFCYTNHTILPEALEKWSISLFETILPRHLQLIYEINQRFLNDVQKKFQGDNEKISRLSLIEEGTDKKVRMANLAIVGSHHINGVSALHSELIKAHLFKDFNDIWPDKFINVTNGITPRRWLKLCNPLLSNLINEAIGDKWTENLFELKKLIPFSNDKEFIKKWAQVKHENKRQLSNQLRYSFDTDINHDSLFDCQIKRIHEYKRQHLNALHLITLYNQIKDHPNAYFVPRTVMIGGKAAPGYYLAKLIIKLISNIQEMVNNDPVVSKYLKVLFLPNYRISLAEMVIPAIDLSEQISTAGYEASGTGNMKFALNGALTIGTLDGANIEIKEAVGDDNIFIFGMSADEVLNLKRAGYNPYEYYQKNSQLKRAIDQLRDGVFSPDQPSLFKPIVDSLLSNGDPFFVLADYEAYIACQRKVSAAFAQEEQWAKSSILNVANMGIFSSDRAILDYCKIWDVKPVKVEDFKVT